MQKFHEIKFNLESPRNFVSELLTFRPFRFCEVTIAVYLVNSGPDRKFCFSTTVPFAYTIAPWQSTAPKPINDVLTEVRTSNTYHRHKALTTTLYPQKLTSRRERPKSALYLRLKKSKGKPFGDKKIR